MDPLLPDLQRPRDGAMVAGVCAALARRWQVDPLLVRVAALLLALSGGFGILLYAWTWFVLPQQGRRRGLAEQFLPQMAQWSRQRLVVTGLVGSLVLCLMTAPVTSWSIAPGLVLLALVVLGRRHTATTAPSSGSPTLPSAGQTEFAAAIDAWSRRLASLDQGAPSPLPSQAPLAPAATARAASTQGTIHFPAPVPAVSPGPAISPVPSASPASSGSSVRVRSRRSRRPSWWIGLVVMVLAAAPFALDPPLPAQDHRMAVHALSLGILALCLLLAWLLRLPRPRMAVPVALVVLGSALLPVPQPGSVQPVDVHWTSTSQLPTQPLQVTAQEGTVDLSDLRLPADGPPARLTIRATAADLALRLPEGAVRVDYRLNGATIAFGGDDSAAGILSGRWESAGHREPRLVVRLELTGANAEVDHA